MKLKYIAPVVGAAMFLGGGMAAAQTTTGAIGGGTAVATDRGAAVSGGVMGGTTASSEPGKMKRHDRAAARDARREGRDASTRAPEANTASTYGAGSVYTDRNSTSAGVTSGGIATGTGSQATSSTVDAYGETSRDGASADIYGSSTAESQTRR